MKEPRKITLAKVIIIGGLVSGIYFGAAFIPPYYGYYRATSIMKDEGSKAYSLRHQKAGWAEIESKIHRRVRDRLADTLKISSEQLYVRVRKKPKHIVITAEWSTYAKWPLVGKSTKLKFKETVKTSLR